MPKSTLLAGAVTTGAVGLAYLAWSQPVYFAAQTSLGGLILLELLMAAIYKFRQVFFVALILAFLLAGMSVPGAAIGVSGRWLFLGVGAVVGLIMLVRDRHHHFGVFHTTALFAVLTATVSAIVSRYPGFSLLKALSLFLLFLYAASGARLAVKGRETRFFAGLLLGCELLVGSFAVSYLVLDAQILGNPNSLGAITGVVAAPVLLWGALVGQDVTSRRRRFCFYAICMFLVYYSHSRASIVAAVFSCGLLCVGLRRYRTLAAGVGVALIQLSAGAILRPERLFETASTVTSEVVYKGFREKGMLGSRQSPWQDAVRAIRSHFWFGTGFGTSDNGKEAGQLGKFASSSQVTAEYGSSYLKLATWVGMLGVMPFFVLLLLLTGKVFRTFSWMLSGGDPSHPAIPLAMLMVGGMLHAAFEDWMFAPGYYLCVFFWSMAFVLVDLTPLQVRPQATRLVPGFSRPPSVMRTAAPAR